MKNKLRAAVLAIAMIGCVGTAAAQKIVCVWVQFEQVAGGVYLCLTEDGRVFTMNS